MPSTSGWARSESGLLLMIMAALPLIRVRDILWNNCLVAMFSSIPWWRDRAAPILFVCSTATLWKPPRVSTAKGRKEIPCSWQAWAAPSTLRLKAFSRAPPAAAAAEADLKWTPLQKKLQTWKSPWYSWTRPVFQSCWNLCKRGLITLSIWFLRRSDWKIQNSLIFYQPSSLILLHSL